jgi:hypothetical protein
MTYALVGVCLHNVWQHQDEIGMHRCWINDRPQRRGAFDEDAADGVAFGRSPIQIVFHVARPSWSDTLSTSSFRR